MTTGTLSPERQRAVEYLTTRAEAMPGAQVLARFRAAVGELEAVVEGLDEVEARTAWIPGEWTAAQVVDHLAQTTARNVDELRHLVEGRRPPAPPVYEALVSGAAHRVPWEELKAGLAEANAELAALLARAAAEEVPAARTIRTILVINRTRDDGTVEPEHFDAELGWKGYALTARLHLLDHRTQVRRLLRARGESQS
ncbi:MAG TPA: DinB family protein [Methylomirabilota bacterium]|nr:DinB family protein [Methylomirabilota bacterium]